MAATAPVPATAAARPVDPSHWWQATPISAESTLPPMMDQGCASGLAGTANSNTAEAPMGAMNQTLEVPSA